MIAGSSPWWQALESPAPAHPESENAARSRQLHTLLARKIPLGNIPICLSTFFQVARGMVRQTVASGHGPIGRIQQTLQRWPARLHAACHLRLGEPATLHLL